MISSGAFAQHLFTENFDYTAGDSIGAYGWNWNTGITNTIKVVSPGLTFTGYPLSGIGNSCYLYSTGNDAYRNLSFDSTKTGSVYASFMVNVDTGRTGDYFFSLLQSGSTSFYEGRVTVRSIDGTGNLSFGILKANFGSDTNVANIWTPHVYSRNTTYVLVVKYTFVPGTANDAVSLYVFDSSFPMTEPGTPTVGPISAYTSTDATAIGRVALRQGTNTRAPSLKIDGIRVATTWFTTVLSLKMSVQGISTGSTLGISDSATVYIRNSALPYEIVDSSFTVIDAATLNAPFLLSNTLNGNYYLDVRYRHSPMFRNGINTWSGTALSITPYNGGSYNFTSAASQAYGDNQIFTGSLYSMYNGDVNQDETIDAGDIGSTENNIDLDGYSNQDVNGDNYVDASDLALVENNVIAGVGVITP